MVVFIVRVAEPAPVIEAGLNPPLEIAVGKPFSLPTLRVMVPLNPLKAWVLTVKVADWPGVTVYDEGVTVMEKSGPPVAPKWSASAGWDQSCRCYRSPSEMRRRCPPC